MDLGLILLLILLNGVFAMAEIALVSSRKARLQRLADEGRAAAVVALALQDSPSRFLSTTQVGITTVGILSGAIGENLLSDPLAQWLAQTSLAAYAEPIALGCTVLLITYLSVVVGELVPKRLALLSPESIAMVVARPMNYLARIVSPLVWLLSSSCTLLIRLLGVRHREEPPITEEEIKVLMEEGAEAGVFQENERAFVANVLQLDELSVGAIMCPRQDIYAIDLQDELQEQLRRLSDSPYSRVPVCRGGFGRVVGVLQRSDLLKPALEGTPIDLERVLHPPLYVHEEVTCIALLERFRTRRQEFAIIVDEFDDLQGIVTLRDVLTAIVGNFPNAGQEGEPEIIRRKDGSWLIDGGLPIERLKQVLDIRTDLPGEEEGVYHTLAGLVMHCLQRVPAITDRFECGGWRFEVLDMDRTRIDKVLAVPLAPSPES